MRNHFLRVALGILVLLEKTAPAPKLIGRLISVALIAAGLFLLSVQSSQLLAVWA